MKTGKKWAEKNAYLRGISVAARNEMFVAIVNHPHLGLVLALVEEIAD